MKKGITKWLIGAFALTMAVVQPASPVPETLNTVVTAEAATTAPGKIKLKSIKAVTNNRIQINWEKTSGATHYRIFYKQYGAKRWTVLKTTNADTTSYTHISSAKYPIKCGQRYTYTVRAYNSRTRKWGSYDAKGLTARTVPTTVKLKSIRTDSAKTTVQVSWNRAYGGNYYRIYRRTANTGWNLIANVRSTALSYTDSNPVKGQKNIYTVRMYNSAMKVAGGYSTAGLSVTIPKTGTAVGTPKLTAIRSTAYNKISLSWEKAANATHYRVYYKVPGTAWKLIDTVGSNVTSYTHTSTTQYPIRCGQKYTYTVRAYNNNTKKLGGYDAVGLSAYTVPSTVTLKTAALNTDGTVTVSWEKADGGNSYRVYRKTTSAPSWKLIDTVNSSVLSYTDKSPVVGETNTYTVRMHNSVANVAGGYDGNGVSVTIPDEPEMTLDEMAQEIIRLTNEERAKKGAAPLERHHVLDNLAKIRAEQLPVTGLSTGILGIHENLFINTSIASPEKIINNWMNIPEYRDAILNPYNHVTGIAVYKASDGKTYLVQLIADYVGYIVGTICHINLDATGGTCKVNSFMVLWGSSFTQSELPIPTREGYTFKGWTGTPESDEPFISISPIWDEETLYAIWEPNS
ncbi:MAG: CAP domain-containing protein [Blautia sp.]